MNEKQSAIQRAKDEETLAREEWLKAMQALGENLNDQTLEYADDCRIAWKAAEKKLAQLEGRE